MQEDLKKIAQKDSEIMRLDQLLQGKDVEIEEWKQKYGTLENIQQAYFALES